MRFIKIPYRLYKINKIGKTVVKLKKLCLFLHQNFHYMFSTPLFDHARNFYTFPNLFQWLTTNYLSSNCSTFSFTTDDSSYSLFLHFYNNDNSFAKLTTYARVCARSWWAKKWQWGKKHVFHWPKKCEKNVLTFFRFRCHHTKHQTYFYK